MDWGGAKVLHRPTIGLAVGTFGSPEWEERGKRAMKAALALNDFDAWCHCHNKNLQWARNGAAEGCGDVDYIVFLDGDDMLANGYSAAIRQALVRKALHPDYDYWLVQPSTRGVYDDGSMDDEAVLIPPKDLYTSNFMVIGTACPKPVFDELDGFRDLPVLEDWDLWIRMVTTGRVGITTAADAVYGVGVTESKSRNSHSKDHVTIYKDIKQRYRNFKGDLARVKVL